MFLLEPLVFFIFFKDIIITIVRDEKDSWHLKQDPLPSTILQNNTIV